jgi:cell division protein FtsQ
MTVNIDAKTAAKVEADQPVALGEKRQAVRRARRGRNAAMAFGVIALVALAVWVVWFSPLLAVGQVTVKGDTTLAPSEVIAAAAVPLGTPLARVDAVGVAQRIQALPRVGDVEVRRGFPRELVLVVNERIPVAVVTSEGSTLHTVDSSGAIIGRVASAGTLPVITTTAAQGRAAALAVITTMPATLLHDVASVAAGSPDSVNLTLRKGTRVVWGDSSRPERKAQVLSALMHRPAAVYDVSAPDFPATRNS